MMPWWWEPVDPVSEQLSGWQKLDSTLRAYQSSSQPEVTLLQLKVESMRP